LTGRTIRSDTAMTGEISLRGLVLSDRALRKKVLARDPGRITHCHCFPARKPQDIEDIPEKRPQRIPFFVLA